MKLFTVLKLYLLLYLLTEPYAFLLHYSLHVEFGFSSFAQKTALLSPNTRLNRQRHAHAQAPAGGVFQHDLAAMTTDHVARDGHAQADAAGHRVA